MQEKRFSCSAEQLPMILRMALTSLRVDWEHFSEFSPTVFTQTFMSDTEAKISAFEQMDKASDIQKHQKAITTQELPAAQKELQLLLNTIEGYMKLAAPLLDIKPEDFKLGKVRDSLHSKDVGAIVSTANSFLTHLKRNEAPLQTKGMKVGTVEAVADKISQIEILKDAQYDFKNRSGRAVTTNIEAGNELWDILKTITDTGTALFKGIDAVKQREYSVSAIQKRMNNTKSSSSDDKKDGNTTTESK